MVESLPVLYQQAFLLESQNPAPSYSLLGPSQSMPALQRAVQALVHKLTSLDIPYWVAMNEHTKHHASPQKELC